MYRNGALCFLTVLELSWGCFLCLQSHSNPAGFAHTVGPGAESRGLKPKYLHWARKKWAASNSLHGPALCFCTRAVAAPLLLTSSPGRQGKHHPQHLRPEQSGWKAGSFRSYSSAWKRDQRGSKVGRKQQGQLGGCEHQKASLWVWQHLAVTNIYICVHCSDDVGPPYCRCL